MARIKQSLALGFALSFWQTVGIMFAGLGMALMGWYTLRSMQNDPEMLGKHGSVQEFNISQGENQQIQVQYACPEPYPIHISVYHVSGNEVHHVQLNDQPKGDIPISTENWAPGLYIVQLNTGIDVLKRKVRI